MPEGLIKVGSPEELQERYGDLALRLSIANSSAYLLCKAFRAEDPPLYVTDKTCMAWLRMYASELDLIHSSGS